MPMRAGRLRHRVTVQYLAETQNELGEVELAWRDEFKAWASVEPIRGRELLNADKVNAELTHSVRMRFDERVTPRKRIRHGCDILEIESVGDVMGRTEQLELLCKRTD